MPDTSTSSRAPRPAQPPRRSAAVQRQGLALRFTLIIGDARLAGALRVVCHQDAVTVEFPEASVRIGLSPLPSEATGGLILHCRATYRADDPAAPASTHLWQRALTGRSGAPHQREALLREVLAARGRTPGPTAAHPHPHPHRG